MKRLKLIIKEKGRFVEIPGLTAFRSPAEVDVTKIKISILLQSLHSCGVNDYELISVSKSGEVLNKWNKNDLDLPEKKKEETDIGDRLEKLENLLLKLVSKKQDKKVNNSEQITNRLSRIERMLKLGSNIVYPETNKQKPVVEELEDQYIPEIDISDMKLSGKSIETIDKKSSKDIDDAVDLLSSLAKNGGK